MSRDNLSLVFDLLVVVLNLMQSISGALEALVSREAMDAYSIFDQIGLMLVSLAKEALAYLGYNFKVCSNELCYPVVLVNTECNLVSGGKETLWDECKEAFKHIHGERDSLKDNTYSPRVTIVINDTRSLFYVQVKGTIKLAQKRRYGSK